jgi:ATP-binding cassette subfamily F protein uup
VREYAGGYSDWKRIADRRQDERAGEEHAKPSRSRAGGAASASGDRAAGAASRSPGDRAAGASKRPDKLSFREQRELQQLPARIEQLEAELARVHETLADPDLYRKEPDAVAGLTARAEALESEIEGAITRWSELAEVEG